MFLAFGLLCQSLFTMLFWSAEERAFELWSQLWSGACKLSEQKVSETKQLFLWKRNIWTTLRYVTTISMLTLLPTSNEPKIFYQFLFASTLFIFLTICKNLNKIKLLMLSIIFIPHLVPMVFKETGLENLKIPQISTNFVTTLNHYFVTHFSTLLMGFFSIFSNDSAILSMLSLSTIFNCAMKIDVKIWMAIMSFGLFVGALKNKCFRIRTFLIVGLILGILTGFGQDIKSLKLTDKSSKPITALTWQKFNQLCPKTGDISNRLLCSNFVGLNVAWEGRVGDIVLERKGRQDLKSIILSFVPTVVQEIINNSFARSKSRESFCRILSSELKIPCDNWSTRQTNDEFQCKVLL